MWNPQVGAGAGPADAGAACEEGKEAAWVESEKYGGHDRFRGGGCVRRREGGPVLQAGAAGAWLLRTLVPTTQPKLRPPAARGPGLFLAPDAPPVVRPSGRRCISNVWTCGCVCVDVWARMWTCGQVSAYVWAVRGRVLLERRGRCVDNAKPPRAHAVDGLTTPCTRRVAPCP